MYGKPREEMGEVAEGEGASSSPFVEWAGEGETEGTVKYHRIDEYYIISFIFTGEYFDLHNVQVTSKQVHVLGVGICRAWCLCCRFLGGTGGAEGAGEMQFYILITGEEVEFTLHLASLKPSNLEMMMIPLAFDEMELQVLARMRLQEVHFL